MIRLSVIIPTHNESKYIVEALQSVSFADEIIVIDSLSKDDTVALSKPLSTKIISRAFDNFSNQKNAAIQEATGDWILFLDADERITPKLKDQILSAIKHHKYGGYKLKFIHNYMGKFLTHHTDKVLRLVRNDNIKFTGLVHEKLNVSGQVGTLSAPVLHYTYKNLKDYITKKEFYSTFQASQKKEKGKKGNWFAIIFKPFYRFLSSYIIKRQAILDGKPGLVVSKVNAYGVFLRSYKLWLLNAFDEEQSSEKLQLLENKLARLHEESTQAARAAFDNGKRNSYLKIILKPYLKFLKLLFIKGNLFKGKEGYASAYLIAFFRFKQEVELWLLHKGMS